MALIHFSQKAPELMPKLIVKDTQSDTKQAINALKVMAKICDEFSLDYDITLIPIWLGKVKPNHRHMQALQQSVDQ
jgi:hypothetical protein